MPRIGGIDAGRHRWLIRRGRLKCYIKGDMGTGEIEYPSLLKTVDSREIFYFSIYSLSQHDP